MKKALTFIFQLIPIFCWCGFAVAHNHDKNKGFDTKVTDLGSGIFELRTDHSGNVAVLIGEEGVFMVDTQIHIFIEIMLEVMYISRSVEPKLWLTQMFVGTLKIQKH